MLLGTQNYRGTFFANGLLALICLGLTGCFSPEKKVAERMDTLRVQWQTNMQYQAALPEKVLDWPAAVSLMQEHNLKLRQARIEMTNAHESVVQVFKDLLPTLNLRAGISKRLVDIEKISPDDITFSADSFFNIPGVVNFGARWYVAKLSELRAQAAYQLTLREQTVELYRLFFSADEVRDQRRRLEMQRATAAAMTQVDPFSGHILLTEAQSRDVVQDRADNDLQDHAAEVLGSRDFKWAFSTNGLPALRYQEEPLPLMDTNRVGQLQLKLYALELEAARAQLLGMKLRYWPELNIFVSSPPVYSVSSGQSRWWDAEQVRASADVFWTIDTRGTIARSIRQTKRAQDLQKERYRLEALALIEKLTFTQKLIQTVQQQLGRVNKQLALLLAIGSAQDYASYQKYIDDYNNLTGQQLELKRQLSELNALFWFVDESAWGGSANSLAANG